MEFTQTCAKLKSKDEEKADKLKTVVSSLVEPLKKRGKKEEEDDLFGNGEVSDEEGIDKFNAED